MNTRLTFISNQHVDNSLLQGFRLGDWLVKPMANKLIGAAGELHLEPKVMDTLVFLANARGEVVSRKTLLDSVWQRVVINEEALTRTISELRRALGDSALNCRYIKTVPKRGYLLVAAIETLGITNIAEIKQPAGVPSIAVLPFLNHSLQPDDGHFSDGLTEELICTMAQIRGLHVAASTSVFTFKNSNATIKQIGEALGVTHVLEGSVRKQAQKVRVTTQLVRVEDGFHLWAESFDRVVEDIFVIQEGIAQAVVTALKLQLGLAEKTTLVGVPTTNLNAYEIFLRARLSFQNDQQGMRYQGLAEAEKASRLAPDFAEAQGLAAWIRTLNTISEPYYKNATAIRNCYEAALKVNPFQEEALMAKAIALRWTSWDWAAVKAQFERALAAAPNCPHVLAQFAARFYRDLGAFDVADVLLRQAVSLDPINAEPRTSLAFNLRYQGKFEEAIEVFDHALLITPEHGYALLGKVLTLLSMERYEQAEALTIRIENTASRDNLFATNCRARLYACAGDTRQARRLANKAISLSRESGGEKYFALVGWIELLLGNLSEGTHWLGLALDKQTSQVLTTRAFVQILPARDAIHHPEVQRFLARMNMDDASIAELKQLKVLDAPID